MENEVFDGKNTDKPSTNVLEKGRYEGEVMDIEKFVADSGNNCIRVYFQIEGRKKSDCFPRIASMEWKWSQFLYSIKIRQTGDFQVTRERIVGQKCLIDVIKKPTKTDPEIYENNIRGYSPIEEQTAPIADVPPEDVQVKKSEPVKVTEKPQEVKKDEFEEI